MSTKLKKNSLDIAILGVSAALIIVLQIIAEALKSVLPFSLALGLIPVLVVAQLRGWKSGVILGTIFGLTSFVLGIIQTGGIQGMAIIAFNPIVKVLPRTLVGLLVGCIATLQAVGNQRRKDKMASPTEAKGFRKFSRDYLQSALATLAGVLTNTIGFLGMFYAFAHGRNLGGTVIDFKYILTAVVAINTVIEAASYVVIVPLIVNALRKAKLIRKDLAAESALSTRSAWDVAAKDSLPTAVSILVLLLVVGVIIGAAVAVCVG